MKDSVASVFFAFSTQFEGRVEYMYVDAIGKATIGIGNLIDPVELALPLPFVFKNGGQLAGDADIRADFTAVKSDPTLPKRGHLACRDITRLMLTDPDINNLVTSKAAQFENHLKGRPEFAAFDDWPADAQLGLLSMAWALGPAFRFPNFQKATAASKWLAAANESHMDDHLGGSLVHRNAADRALFRNACYVAANGLSASDLWYTLMGNLAKSLKIGSAGADVATLQDRLVVLGYLGTQSGSFDADTDAAVRAFQAEFGLGTDGIVGGATWAALGTCVPAGAVLVDP